MSAGIRSKALRPVLLLVAVSAAYVSFSVYALYSVSKAVDTLVSYHDELDSVRELEVVVAALGLSADRATDAAVGADITELLQRSATLKQRIEGSLVVEEDERVRLNAITDHLGHIGRLYRELAALDPRSPAARIRTEAIQRRHVPALLGELRGWHEEEREHVDTLHLEVDAMATRFLWLTLGIVLLAGGALAFAFWYNERVLVRPLLALTHGARLLAAGDLKHQIPVETDDETGTLARDINRMAAALDALTTKLSMMAETDTLTGLPNRRAFEHIASAAHADAMQQRGGYALAIIDIDHFKRVNDEHGHAAGDAVLQQIARLCLQNLRASDYCFRFGGEEFVVLLPRASAAAAHATLERCRHAIGHAALVAGTHSLQLTISFGFAVFPEDGDELGALLRRADLALYAAKHRGRDQGLRYTSELAR